jgi:hypothetical protein
MRKNAHTREVKNRSISEGIQGVTAIEQWISSSVKRKVKKMENFQRIEKQIFSEKCKK